ncbi:histidine kinase dimerization/phosphoacceptor domain -containing protein [Maribacter sp. R77961]|uniref:tetratricopeptide repeat-containing sensor histidine kinase n=1 Tax=Maribacter sp. R77961 TaxID=3093871 RepID=UPI0037CAD40E
MASYKLLICLLFLFVNTQLGFAQHNTNAKKLDSLQRVVAKNEDSKKTSTALLALSAYYAQEDTQNLDSLYYYANKTLDVTKGNTELEEQNVDALSYLAYHAYKTEQIDSAKAYNAQVKSISEKLIYGMGLRSASVLSGFIGEKENKPNLAVFYFENAYKVSKDYKLPQNVQFNTALELSSAYLRLKFPKKDISTVLFENLAIVDAPGITVKEKAHFYFNLGVFYSDYNNDHDKAIEKYTAAIALFTTHNAIEKLHDPLMKLAESYQKQGRPKKAIETLQKAMSTATSLKQYNVYGAIYYGLGVSFLNAKDYNAAASHFKEAINAYQKNNDAIGEGTGLQKIGEIHRITGNTKKAKETLHHAINVCKERIVQLQNEQPLNDEIGKAYLLVAEIYELNKNYKESAVYYNLYNKFRDQVYKHQAVLIPEQLNYLEEEIVKTKAIEILESETKIREIEAEKEKNFKLGLGLFLALTTLLAFIMFNRYRLKQKALKLISQKNEEKKLLIREIHHRVKNNLQIISSLLGVKINSTANDKLKLILQESQNKIKSMALIHQNLYNKDEFSKVSVSSYIRELVDNIQKSFDQSKNAIQFQFDLQEKKIQIGLAVPLGLIINELITNSYKYAFANKTSNASTIAITFHQVKNSPKFLLAITDNGIGMPSSFDIENATSFGLQLVHDLVEQLNGTIHTNSKQGTSLEIIVEEPVAA